MRCFIGALRNEGARLHPLINHCTLFIELLIVFIKGTRINMISDLLHMPEEVMKVMDTCKMRA